VNVDRDYVLRLLQSSDALSAVFDLDGLWCARPARPSAPPFGLSEPEFNAHMYLVYQGEVGNGGHLQFFLIPGGAFASETLTALQALGFSGVHTILSRATALFPDSAVPPDWQEREAIVAQFNQTTLDRLHQLDLALYRVDSGLWEPLLSYLREHTEFVLSEGRA